MTLQAAEVVLIPFPFTDLAATKRRPVLVLRAEDPSGDFLAAAVTSQPGYSDAWQLNQEDFLEGRLPKTSWVRTTKLYTLNASVVAHRFGRLTPPAFARVQSAACTAIGCKG